MSNLPKGWKLVQLNDIVKFSNGKGHEQYIDDNGDYIVVNSKFISTNGEICKYSNENLSPLKKGDITLVMSDIPNGRALAKCYLIEEDNKYTLNQRICSLEVKNENNEFLFYKLNRNQYFLKFNDGVNQTNLRKNEVLECPIELPPLEEQKKIADILSTVDKKIALVEENINATEELKKGLMQKLLTEGIGHTEFKDSELGRIPESWELKRLNSVCNKITDGSHFSPIANKNTGFYIATVKDMLLNTFNINTCTHIEENDFKLLEANGCKPENGDILFSKDGTIGKTFVYKDMEIPLVVLSSIAIIKPIYKVLDSSFTMHVLKSNIFYKQLNGLSSGSALKRVVLKAIKEIRIPLPSLEEQKQIAEILSTVDNKLENLKEKKQYFEELKKGLMQKLLTGEVRV